TVRPPVVSTLSEQSASESFDTLAHKKDADPPKQLISLHRLFISLCTLLLITVIGTAVLLLHQRDSYAESLKDSDMHL
ncbi:helix-turn-helix domain-containing protein, partial [Escherichia coli]